MHTFRVSQFRFIRLCIHDYFRQNEKFDSLRRSHSCTETAKRLQGRRYELWKKHEWVSLWGKEEGQSLIFIPSCNDILFPLPQVLRKMRGQGKVRGHAPWNTIGAGCDSTTLQYNGCLVTQEFDQHEIYKRNTIGPLDHIFFNLFWSLSYKQFTTE